MPWKPSLAVTAALLIGAAGAVQAEMHEDAGQKASGFKEIDANGDGVVSLEEARKAGHSDLAENFQKYDANSNKELDQGEFAAFEAERAKKMKEKSEEMMDDE